MAELYPALLNLKNKLCLVVGGGPVAARKAASLVAAGARVSLVSPALCAVLAESVSKNEVLHTARKFEESDLTGVFLVVAATDHPEVNRMIGEAAEANGILANVVDAPEASSFIVPSVIRRGKLLIAIATSAQSPALSRRLRLHLENEIGEEYGELVKLVGEVRAELKDAGTKVSEQTWQNALDLDELVDLLKDRRRDEAKSVLIQRLISNAGGA
ncbi:precorrin-2 dehydrogenase / sirohydrochlorin ferrochelatase [Dehalogenimonas formicexedens]|uniref:precorrin-2 dehydrogenase n=1 Tax=Dehalogenimonas formicexedens TaxID=1839801 RepID=A0A1P8F9G7_9CHLR|nr:bifunctional precorrin-2 dehydrogenase/sirohydrochlorin ferrochelatase [Dehalogenimonas formicexedens]APV45107.1 precorrin-2 dehydrogenase / sirohydrochlorin ferrochelatase [Dehalogenimonas formicexedens]